MTIQYILQREKLIVNIVSNHVDCDVNGRKNIQTSQFEYCPIFLVFVAVRIDMQ